jgi:hypothetical protein
MGGLNGWMDGWDVSNLDGWRGWVVRIDGWTKWMDWDVHNLDGWLDGLQWMDDLMVF